jgi:hypothetical protein
MNAPLLRYRIRLLRARRGSASNGKVIVGPDGLARLLWLGNVAVVGFSAVSIDLHIRGREAQATGRRGGLAPATPLIPASPS